MLPCPPRPLPRRRGLRAALSGRELLAFAAYYPDDFPADEGSVAGLNQR